VAAEGEPGANSKEPQRAVIIVFSFFFLERLSNFRRRKFYNAIIGIKRVRQSESQSTAKTQFYFGYDIRVIRGSLLWRLVPATQAAR